MKLEKILLALRPVLNKIRKELALIANIAMLLASFTTIGLLVYNFGFGQRNVTYNELHKWFDGIMWLFLITYNLRLISTGLKVREMRGKWIEFILMGVLLASGLINALSDNQSLINIFHHEVAVYAILLVISIVEISRWSLYILDRDINPSLLFVASFLLLIFIGTFLLMLPNATVKPIGFIDALFTSTSAVCVTGLMVVDTAAYFTSFGKIIIIILVQIGGIGIMTFTTFIALFFSNKSSFHNRMAMRNLISSDNLNSIFRVLVSIVIVTLTIEAIGAVIIYKTVKGTLGLTLLQEIGFSAFHSISAFCNAGFSTLPGNLYDPLLRTNYTMHTVIAFLIIFGGIGFPILFNYAKLFNAFIKNSLGILTGRQKAYVHTKIISVNTRLAVITTISLLVIGTVSFFLLEYNNTLEGLGFVKKLSVSFFNSVMPRTAGFVNVDMNKCLHSTLFIIIILMWIGASPMSTGGGIKTTTFAIMILKLISTIRGQEKIEIARREINSESISRAHAIVTLSLLWLGISIFLLSVFEPKADLLTVTYECVAAMSTAGLSLNFTHTLGVPSKLVIIVTMFVGRVGLFTILISIVKKFVHKRYSYPGEGIMT